MTMLIEKVHSALGDAEANKFLEENGKSKEWELHAVVGLPSGEEGLFGAPAYIFVQDAVARSSPGMSGVVIRSSSADCRPVARTELVLDRAVSLKCLYSCAKKGFWGI